MTGISWLIRPVVMVAAFAANLAIGATAEAVLQRTLAYHDSEGRWPTFQASFRFAEERPDGGASESWMELDNVRTAMRLSFGGKESYEIVGQTCTVLTGDREAERGLMLRDYFLYLWGLPMKLQDPGTKLSAKVGSSVIDGHACDVIRADYEKDFWFFHIDRATGQMRQYEFYWHKDPGKGEVITLEGEIGFAGLRIPQTRRWYKQPDNEFLGTDKLVEMQPRRERQPALSPQNQD